METIDKYISNVQIHNQSSFTNELATKGYLHLIFYLMGIGDFGKTLSKLKIKGRTKVITEYRALKNNYRWSATHGFYQYHAGSPVHTIDWQRVLKHINDNPVVDTFLDILIHEYPLTDVLNAFQDMSAYGVSEVLGIMGRINRDMEETPDTRLVKVIVEF